MKFLNLDLIHSLSHCPGGYIKTTSLVKLNSMTWREFLTHICECHLRTHNRGDLWISVDGYGADVNLMGNFQIYLHNDFLSISTPLSFYKYCLKSWRTTKSWNLWFDGSTVAKTYHLGKIIDSKFDLQYMNQFYTSEGAYIIGIRPK